MCGYLPHGSAIRWKYSVNVVICVSSVPVKSCVEAQIKYRPKIAHKVEGRGEKSELEGRSQAAHF